MDCDSLVHRLSTSSSPEARALSETFESRSPTLWKCFSLAAEDNSVTMIFVAKFFISRTTSDGDGGMADVSGSGEGVSPEEDGPPREFMLPVVVMQCSQSHVIDVDPARPDVPPLQPDGHAHLVVGETHHVPDLGGLNFLSEQLTLIHRFSFLHTLHMALLQNASGVFPQDFYAALNVCSQTVLSVDVTPLVAGLCSHSVTKMADDSSSLSEGSAPLSTDILCEVLTAVLSKKTGTCLVSLKGADACKEEGEEEDGLDSSKCDLLSSEIDQALSKYLSEVGFFAVPQCPAHFWLNERVGGVATAPSEVSGDAATEDGPGSVDTCKDRGWSESSAGTTSVGKVNLYHPSLSISLLPSSPFPPFLLLPLLFVSFPPSSFPFHLSPSLSLLSLPPSLFFPSLFSPSPSLSFPPSPLPLSLSVSLLPFLLQISQLFILLPPRTRATVATVHTLLSRSSQTPLLPLDSVHQLRCLFLIRLSFPPLLSALQIQSLSVKCLLMINSPHTHLWRGRMWRTSMSPELLVAASLVSTFIPFSLLPMLKKRWRIKAPPPSGPSHHSF